MPFLHKKSSKTTLLKAEIFISRSTYNIIQELHTVSNIYTSRGLTSAYATGKWIWHKCFTRTYKSSKFKHTIKRAPNPHHWIIHSKHQARSALHQTLCAIKKVHQDHDKIACGMHNLFQKKNPTKSQHQKEDRSE